MDEKIYDIDTGISHNLALKLEQLLGSHIEKESIGSFLIWLERRIQSYYFLSGELNKKTPRKTSIEQMKKGVKLLEELAPLFSSGYWSEDAFDALKKAAYEGYGFELDEEIDEMQIVIWQFSNYLNDAIDILQKNKPSSGRPKNTDRDFLLYQVYVELKKYSIKEGGAVLLSAEIINSFGISCPGRASDKKVAETNLRKNLARGKKYANQREKARNAAIAVMNQHMNCHATSKNTK